MEELVQVVELPLMEALVRVVVPEKVTVKVAEEPMVLVRVEDKEQ